MENTRYKILFIEDNQLDQMAFKRFVEENDIPYDCTIAGSVSEAQQALNSDRFDIVITDHSLGDGTAFEILKSAGNTPVIVVTGAGDEETAIKAWKAGAYDYLIKDLDQNYLTAIPITVENAVSHKMIEKKLQLLSGAIMSTDDSVYITDMQGRIIFVNKAFCNTYGYKEQEIIGKNSTVLWVGKQQTENTRSVFQTRTIGSSWATINETMTAYFPSLFPGQLLKIQTKMRLRLSESLATYPSEYLQKKNSILKIRI